MTQSAPSEPRYPPEELLNWSKRQQQVLALLARGKTNPEIAETLGVSLEGAKHHVREVMSKLDVDSREDAAEYWRWRQGLPRRLKRMLAAIPALGPLRVGGGASVAAVVFGATAFALATSSGDGDSEATLSGYYLEYTHESADDGTIRTTYRWWVVDDAHWRHEREGEHVSGQFLGVQGANGESQWSYEPETNRLEVRRGEGQINPAPNPENYPGPMSAEYVAVLLGEQDSETLRVEPSAFDSVLDHPVHVVRTGRLDLDEEVRSEIWFDPDLRVLLRQMTRHQDGPDTDLIALVFKPEVQIPESMLEVPENAEELTEQCDGITGSTWSLGTSPTPTDARRTEFQDEVSGAAPPGMFGIEPADGWWLASVSVEWTCLERGEALPGRPVAAQLEVKAATSFTVRFAGADTPDVDQQRRTVSITQEFGSQVPENRRLPRELTVDGHLAYGNEEMGDSALHWSDGERVIRIMGQNVGLAELMRFAEQLREP